jgi:hypothetical protein
VLVDKRRRAQGNAVVSQNRREVGTPFIISYTKVRDFTAYGTRCLMNGGVGVGIRQSCARPGRHLRAGIRHQQ